MNRPSVYWIALGLPGLFVLTLACASPAPAPRIDAPVLVPDRGERVSLDQLVVLVDASASMPKDTLFRDQKALLESLVRSAPEGSYETSLIGFGGFRREVHPLEAFPRDRLASEAATLSHLDEGTPIHTAIETAAGQLEGRGGRAALLIFSDGELSDGAGRPLDPRLALAAAERAAAGHGGTLCIHGVQTGESAAGAALLEQLSRISDCGSFRRAERIDGIAALHRFERQVFLGAGPPALPAVAAAPADADRDGVVDASDLCPGTPRGAAADERGCWTIRNLRFPTDSAAIGADGARALEEVATVLRRNPALRVRVEGHADARGSEGYNLKLSQRRADAARDYLLKQGISAERLEARGLGEGRPAVANDGEAGWQTNRRTEITVLR